MSEAVEPGSLGGGATWTEFVELDERDRRELIDGALLEVEVPSELHEYVVAALAYFLFGWSRAHGGRAYVSGYKLRVSDSRGVMPDLQFYRDADLPVGQPQGLTRGRPDLVVEVVSETSSRYDRVTKLNWYAELGIPEYWIVDPQARTLERLTLSGQRYVIASSLADDASFTPETFAGLEIPLAELWGTTASAS